MTERDGGFPGVPEPDWRDWFAAHPPATLDLAPLLAADRVVVLAAHPDDEVLGVGGLLQELARRRVRPHLVWATDGEASHPHASAGLLRGLAARRRAESAAALEVLGVEPADVQHLALPDSGLAGCADELWALLSPLVGPGDAVLAPWAHDGHPDHEAVGQAAVRAAPAVLWQYPVWAWHWAIPGEPGLPLDRAVAWPVPPDDLARKAAAVDAFESQVRPLGSGTGSEPVLPAEVLAHFGRPFEVLLP